MSDFDFIKKQLEAFIKRYYTNELLKGAILFVTIWLLYFLLILFIEYFLWLSPPGRSILFWLFIAVSAGLFFRFILIPLGKLFKISKGIDQLEASRIIGKHFPNVNDKLLNVLQLQSSGQQSDLLMAGIAQKSRELKPVPFKLAVNFNSSIRYLKYAAFPVIIILAIIVTGNMEIFSESYTRMVHYNTTYEPPAPFSFHLNNEVLQVEEGKDLHLDVETLGSITPETVAIHYNDEVYYLNNTAPTRFNFDFQSVKEDFEFYLSGNGVTSRSYEVNVVKVPTVVDFELTIDYPRYLNKPSEAIKGTGNITVPEGSRVLWNLQTRTTDEVLFSTEDTLQQFVKEADLFSFSKQVFNNINYQIKTSNKEVKDHEVLEYSVAVIQDQYPKILIQHKRDSINDEILYFFGKASDDYAVSKVNLVYYQEQDESASQKVSISINKEDFNEFLYAFPNNLALEKGKNYQIYFEVYDNDGVNGSKRSKSEVFNYRKKSEQEVKEEQLQKQGESIDNLSESLDKMQFSEQELEELTRVQKEKKQLNFNDRKRLDEFLERQKQQTELMKNYSEKLKKSLEEEGPNESNQFKEELNKRLERNEERLEENEALLEELQKYSDKISREELSEKLEELSKQNTNEQKNLEQLLELTKRYYVQEKTQKLSNDLQELAKKQEQIFEADSLNTKKNQEVLTEVFEDIKEQMDELQKENEGLKKPYDLDRDKQEETEVEEEQKEAEEKLEQNNKEEAKKNQKSAAEKMKEMSSKMKKSQMMSQGEQLNANIESLRQILDNLMVFSFEQEALLMSFREMRPNNPAYAAKLKEQQVLKEHFHHVDDSLFALAVNNPMITEKITSKLTDIEFDINKSLERLAQNELPQGTSSQQYVMTGTNDLALMLSEVLGNMQEMASPSMSPGSGGQDMQLQDIIMSQEQLNKQMEQGMSKGEGEKPNDSGEKGKEGENGKKGEEKGEKLTEEMSGRLFEIFKQQQLLKQQLENKLNKNGVDRTEVDLLREMEEVEKDILDKGFNPETLKRMNNITHKLMELDNATIEQEEDSQRRARTNLKEFENTSQNQILKAKEYFNSTEILNRQALPLRQIYKAKVKQYFEAGEN